MRIKIGAAVVALAIAGVGAFALGTPAAADDVPDLAACHSGSGAHWSFITPDANGYNGHKNHDLDVFGLTEAECLAKNPVEEEEPETPPADPTPFVLIAWQMPGDGNPSWPQPYFLHIDLASPSLDAFDAQLTACGTDWQLDLENDSPTTAALLAYAIGGGLLLGPNNPLAEDHAYGAVSGNPWKFINNADCEEEPVKHYATPSAPVVKDKCGLINDHYGLPTDTESVTYARGENRSIIATHAAGLDGWENLPAGYVDNGDGTATFPFSATEWTREPCPLPSQFSVPGEWSAAEYDCDDTSYVLQRLVTLHSFLNDADGEVVETLSESTEFGEAIDLTPEQLAELAEREECQEDEPTPTPTPTITPTTSSTNLPITGTDPMLPVGFGAVILLAGLVGLIADRVRRRSI